MYRATTSEIAPDLSIGEHISAHGFAMHALPWNHPLADTPSRENNEFDPITGMTEADALREFSGKLTYVIDLLHAYNGVNPGNTEVEKAISTASKMFERLIYADTESLGTGCDALADYWSYLLQSGQRQRLNVAASSNSSSLYIANMIRNRLIAKSDDPLIAERVRIFDVDDEYPDRPFNPEIPSNPQLSDRTQQEIREEGLLFVEDWSITGSQLRIMIEAAAEQLKLDPSDMQVNLVYATADTLENGIEGVEGVQVYACYMRPSYRDSDLRDPITGTHSVADYCFRNPMMLDIWDTAQAVAPDQMQDITLPNLLYPYNRYRIHSRHRDF